MTTENAQREHSPAQPETIGQSTGLVYCMACGYLLSSDNKGHTARANKPCVPVHVDLRTPPGRST